MVIDKLVVGELQTNCYIITDSKTKKSAIVDPGADHEKIKTIISKKQLHPQFIINTHGHADHIMADNEFDLPVYIHREDADFLVDSSKNLSTNFMIDFKYTKRPAKLLKHGDVIHLGNLIIKVIHTPGHTPGGICLLCEDNILSGDTLFESGIGRTDLPYGDHQKLITAIKEKLFILSDNVKVYPGHGPETTIGREKHDNPWLDGESV